MESALARQGLCRRGGGTTRFAVASYIGVLPYAPRAMLNAALPIIADSGGADVLRRFDVLAWLWAAQLLPDPGCRRVRRHVPVDDSAAFMCDHEGDVEGAKRQRLQGKKSHAQFSGAWSRRTVRQPGEGGADAL